MARFLVFIVVNEPVYEGETMKIPNKVTTSNLDTSKLLRMPWTNSDNAFSWLEITRRCNLNCDYCYQKNRAHSDKNIIQVEAELKTILKYLLDSTAKL